MISITIEDKTGPEPQYYYARVTFRWARKHDSGALISCGLHVGEDLSPRALAYLRRRGRLTPITRERWQHSSCQSACTARGDKECRW